MPERSLCSHDNLLRCAINIGEDIRELLARYDIGAKIGRFRIREE